MEAMRIFYLLALKRIAAPGRRRECKFSIPEPVRKSAKTRPLLNMQLNMQGFWDPLIYPIKSMGSGGDEGIRTLETVSRLHP